MDDQTAISRLKQGDLYGLETLVSRYQVQAVHAAYMILHDRPLAEDVVQAAFVKVAERIEQFDDGRPFAPWFYRIVVNDALKLSKKRERNVPLEEQLDEPTVQLGQWLVDPELQPEPWVEQEEMRQTILKAIYSLPPGQRAVMRICPIRLGQGTRTCRRPGQGWRTRWRVCTRHVRRVCRRKDGKVESRCIHPAHALGRG